MTGTAQQRTAGDPGGGGFAASGYVERVQALQSFGRSEEAIAEARRGLGEYPGDVELSSLLAWLLFFDGELEEAESAAAGALAADPRNARALTVMCEIAVVRQDADGALAFARTQLEHYPDWAGAHLGTAHALLSDTRGGRKAKRRRSAEVREHVDSALQLAPEDVETLRRSAVMLDRIGRRDEAVRVLDRALALDPTNSELLLLESHLGAADEREAIRLISGVLAENPEHRAAARALSETVWARTGMLASMLLLVLAALLLFGYLVFEEGLDSTARQRRQMAWAFIGLCVPWFYLFVRLRAALPWRYLGRLFRSVWWVWIGLAVALVSFLGSAFAALAFAVRSQPAQYEMSGGYIGGLTAMVAFVAWLVLVAEILIVTAAFVSERSNGLFPPDPEGVRAARARLRGTATVAAIRLGLGALVALTPMLGAGIATRPEAVGAFAPLAAAVALPPLISLLLGIGGVLRLDARRIRREGGSRPGRTTGAVLAYAVAGMLAFGGVVGTWMLADRHAAEYDPPPTPWELQTRERGERIRENIEERDRQMEQLERALERLEEASPPGGG